jgi:hypothetical protein
MLTRLFEQRMAGLERQFAEMRADFRESEKARERSIRELADEFAKRMDKQEVASTKLSLEFVGQQGFSNNARWIGGSVLVIVITSVVTAISSLFHVDFAQQISNPPAVTQQNARHP